MLQPFAVSNRFKGRVALVTGSSSGIGAATARRLASEGASVVVTGLEANLVADVVQRIRDDGNEAIGIVADLRDRAAPGRLIDRAIERYGKIDILVNNAALVLFKGMLDTDEAGWDAILEVNLRAVVRLSCRAVAHMPKDGTAAIINVSSGAAIQGSPDLVAYSATKGAILSLTRSMALELVAHGIRVNAVSPGSTRTEGSKPGENIPHLAAPGLPVGYKAEPEDVAGVIAFLASSDASYIYGQTLVVDGGRSVVMFPRSSPWREGAVVSGDANSSTP